ncbi:MAG: hypothetical protein NVSMB45_03390 [Ginsengibacter sp.]
MAENVIGLTDKGKIRDNNEDAFIAEAFGHNYIIAAAIDGVGGYSGGEIAAEIAKQSLLKLRSNLGTDILVSLSECIIEANEKIYDERLKVKEHYRMACVLTAIVADLNHNLFYYAHIGDTRLYLYRDGSLVKVTRDHSSVGYLEETGRLTEQEAMRHPKRNEINKALGFDHHDLNEKFIDVEQSPFLPGDLLLICSDGLTDMVNQNQITSILEAKFTLKEKAEKLILAANDAGGKDNVTVVLVKNTNTGIPHLQIKKQERQPENTFIPDHKPPITKNAERPIEEPPLPAKLKKTNSWMGFLVLLSLVAILYFLQSRNKHSVSVLPSTVINVKYESLQDSINSSNRLLNLSGNTIVLSHTLYIKKDSFHIIGNGTKIKSDSLFHGAAFLIDSSCHSIWIDSLTFENFNTGILVMKKGLHMNSIHFQNCKSPVKYQFLNTKDSIR